MLSDLRFAFRMILKHRWFSAAVMVTLALGIGINTTVFTLVNAVLFKPVPLPGGENLVVVGHQHLDDPDSDFWASWPEFQAYTEQNRSFDALEGVIRDRAVISESDVPPERYSMARVSAGIFDMIQTRPVIGRPFAATDDDPGAERVVMLGHRVWQNRYAGDPDIIGRSIRVNEQPATIIGVMPEQFRFPSNQDVWLPMIPDEKLEERDHRPILMFGLLKPKVSINEAQHDLMVTGQRLAVEFPETNENVGPLVRTFHQAFNGGEIEVIFLMMLGAVGFVLLIACANVANMMLSRAIARSHEISIRAAMGASRTQIIRQLLIESVMLSTLGGLLGLTLSALGVHAFDLATQDVGKPYWIIFSMDWRAFLYFAAISTLSGVVFGLLPAIRASRVDLNTALKDGTRSVGGAHGNWLSGSLVVLQFALTVVLLAGAGVMVRSFFAAQTVNEFVPAEQIFTGRLFPPEGEGERYHEEDSRRQFYQELVNDLRELPGVTQAAAASNFPGMGASDRTIEIDGRPITDPEDRPQASMVVQTPGYLELINLPILLGRDFNHVDGTIGHEASVITRRFAAQHWPDESAIGKRFRILARDEEDDPGPWMTVIGVCADINQDPGETDPAPLMYISHQQDPWSWMGILLRTNTPAAAMGATVRATVQARDQDLPVYEMNTLSGAWEKQTWFLAVFGSLFFAFALIALLMASVGIYGVVAQSTARRTREIGIRMALGATSGSIITMVIKRGLIQLGLGLAIGLAGGVAATGLMENTDMLFGTSSKDPVVFTAIALLLVVIGLFACWLPARRAAGLHPVKALRDE